MKVEVTGKGVDVTEIVRSHAEEKADRLDKYGEGVRHMKVILESEGDRYRAEAIAAHRRGKNFIGKGADKDLCAAVDRAVEKIERQLAKFKERRDTKKIRGASRKSR